jgi:hypothetical protein
MQSRGFPERSEALMPRLSLLSRVIGRRAIVVVAALAALAVAAPLANAAGPQKLGCQDVPSHWTRVVDEQGVPWLQLVDGTSCTNAVTVAACGSQRSPYPGWVQVTDEIGVPTLYRLGFEPVSSTSCVQTAAAESTGRDGRAAAASPQFGWPPLQSPSPGWGVVFDEQGVPTLEQSR